MEPSFLEHASRNGTGPNPTQASPQTFRPSSGTDNVWSDAECRVCKISHEAPEYSDVLHVRSRASRLDPGVITSDVDRASDIYAMYVGTVAIATVSATRGNAGRFDCHEHYPASLVEAFRSVIISPYRLAVVPEHQGNGSTARLLLLRAWEHQVLMGARAMIINVHEPMIPYYRRMGFRVARDSSFIHPRLGTASRVALCATEPAGGRGLEKVVQNVTNPVTYDRISRYAPLEP
jgi:GNAT superfamily N-acetyltransferase